VGQFWTPILAKGGSLLHADLQNLPQTEQLFVSGLLHDIGRLIVFKYFPDQAKVLLKHAKETDKPLFQIESNHLGYSHTYIGKYLLQKWKLPPALADNVFFHHNPSNALDCTKATIVHLADIIVNGLGIGNSGESVIPHFDYEAWENLKISPRIFKVVIEQAVHQLPSLETFFSRAIA